MFVRRVPMRRNLVAWRHPEAQHEDARLARVSRNNRERSALLKDRGWFAPLQLSRGHQNVWGRLGLLGHSGSNHGHKANGTTDKDPSHLTPPYSFFTTHPQPPPTPTQH